MINPNSTEEVRGEETCVGSHGMSGRVTQGGSDTVKPDAAHGYTERRGRRLCPAPLGSPVASAKISASWDWEDDHCKALLDASVKVSRLVKNELRNQKWAKVVPFSNNTNKVVRVDPEQCHWAGQALVIALGAPGCRPACKE